MTPLDLLEAAIRLAIRPDSGEAEFRAAIHMAYYAAYHRMSAHFGLDVTKKEALHKKVIRFIDAADATSAGPPVLQAKKFYLQLFNARIDADYHLGCPMTFDDAYRAIIFADGMVTAVP